jgi:hypothetical protein
MLSRNEQKRLTTNVLFTPDGIAKIKRILLMQLYLLGYLTLLLIMM